MRRLALILLALNLALPLASPADGGASQQPPPRTPQEDYRMRVRVEMVTAPLVVWDKSGEFVYDLRREEVALLDNGIPQQMSTFELASEPISLVVLIDTSQRVAPLLDRVRPSGVLFTSYILGEQGEGALITFDSEVRLQQGLTRDPDALIRAVEKITPGGTDTRLADALDQAVALLASRPEGRRGVIVAITEPRDRGSELPLGVPLRRAQLFGISVYTISLSGTQADLLRRPEDTTLPQSPYPPGVFPTPPLPGQVQTPTTEAQRQYGRADLLSAVMLLVTTLRNTTRENVNELYAQGTGGLHFEPLSRQSLEEAVNRIGQDLHNQYMVSYRPSNRDEEGFHCIEIRVSRSDVRVRTRPGYYVGPPL